MRALISLENRPVATVDVLVGVKSPHRNPRHDPQSASPCGTQYTATHWIDPTPTPVHYGMASPALQAPERSTRTPRSISYWRDGSLFGTIAGEHIKRIYYSDTSWTHGMAPSTRKNGATPRPIVVKTRPPRSTVDPEQGLRATGHRTTRPGYSPIPCKQSPDPTQNRLGFSVSPVPRGTTKCPSNLARNAPPRVTFSHACPKAEATLRITSLAALEELPPSRVSSGLTREKEKAPIRIRMRPSFGSGAWDRTKDLVVNSHPLYR